MSERCRGKEDADDRENLAAVQGLDTGAPEKRDAQGVVSMHIQGTFCGLCAAIGELVYGLEASRSMLAKQIVREGRRRAQTRYSQHLGPSGLLCWCMCKGMFWSEEARHRILLLNLHITTIHLTWEFLAFQGRVQLTHTGA
jgi:hypothetical protein